jgi:putative transcriptional regulator
VISFALLLRDFATSRLHFLDRHASNARVPARAGQLLVASRRLTDPNFAHAVVLLVQHDTSGVLGLILNRPLEITVAESCGPSIEAAVDIAEEIHQGGPCAGPLMVLHDDPAAGGEEILPGVRFVVQRDQIESLMREGHGRVRYYAGYSGWAVDQLDAELEEGAWLTASADAELVFTPQLESLWSDLMTRLTLGQWIDPDKVPDDPSVN